MMPQYMTGISLMMEFTLTHCAMVFFFKFIPTIYCLDFRVVLSSHCPVSYRAPVYKIILCYNHNELIHSCIYLLDC